MNPWPPIEPEDEKIYNIRLTSGLIINNVEFWAFGGGFIIKESEMVETKGKYVDFRLEEITGFELVS